MTDKIIIALDYRNREDALGLVEKLSGIISFYKVGLELYTSVGPEIVRDLKAKWLKVFLDLKFFDIPSTVAKAGRAAVSLGVDIFNLHLLAGREALVAAKEAAHEEAARRNRTAPKILGVAILTSSSGTEWQDLGLNYTVPELVVRLTERAKEAGLDGVVASARDAAVIKERFGRDFLVVSPGIRSYNVGAPFMAPAGSINRAPTNADRVRCGGNDDQKRTLSAKEAFNAGCDYIVVGRPVTRAPDPKKACLDLLK
ncbi:MAG: orotidine-5'-phosphate decarboxylase [Candidatus Omnitrophota bacterium]